MIFIALILIVGVGAYFMGKKSVVTPTQITTEQSDEFGTSTTQNHTTTQNQTTITQNQSACAPTTAPWIKVTSPNGGEVFTAGQQMNITWQSCNVPASTHLNFSLETTNGSGNTSKALLCEGGMSTWTNDCLNDGHQTITLGTNWATQGTYKVSIIALENVVARDMSDAVFTINGVAQSHVSTTISSQYIAGSHWPPTITTSASAYSCVPSTNEITVVTQKVINGRTYCVSSTVDGGAGHYGGDYVYTRANGAGTKTATFQLQWGSCGVYGGPYGNPIDPQYTQCKQDQDNVFNNLDVMVDSLM